MNVDTQTLKDLQIVGTHSVAASCVLQLIDRTRTSVGRQALREKLVAPYTDRGAIEAAQRAHIFLADMPRHCVRCLNRRSVMVSSGT